MPASAAGSSWVMTISTVESSWQRNPQLTIDWAWALPQISPTTSVIKKVMA